MVDAILDDETLAKNNFFQHVPGLKEEHAEKWKKASGLVMFETFGIFWVKLPVAPVQW